MTESNRIGFKRELTKELDIEREVVAFLNYREGGTIYVGIDDDGKPVGVKDIDGDMLKLKDRIRMGVLPSPMGLFDVQTERIDGIQVIKIVVASGNELMRIYRDVELVESLGSGIPRILRAYGEDCFRLTENFIRLVLPVAQHPATDTTQNGGKDGGLKVEDIAAKMKLGKRTIERELATLQKLGIIRRAEGRKGGYREIIPTQK